MKKLQSIIGCIFIVLAGVSFIMATDDKQPTGIEQSEKNAKHIRIFYTNKIQQFENG